MFENCAEIREYCSDHVDGICSPEVIRSIRFHLDYCLPCQQEFERAQDVRSLLQSLPRTPAPEAIQLRLRVRMSRELHRNILGHLWVRLENRFSLGLLPAIGGMVCTVFFFCLVMGSEMAPVSKMPDVPVSFVTPAQVVALAPLNFAPGDKPVVVVTYIDPAGRVLKYSVLSGQHSPALMRQLDRLIYYSRYSPATTFGKPTEGRVVLAFSQVTIRG
ncbi:MAG: zf-HC2 domain-containing protein [Acidobacteriota bacterium]|nr:zf-HC2 domain-containing protein [Acidobacteriota bacterium]